MPTHPRQDVVLKTSESDAAVLRMLLSDYLRKQQAQFEIAELFLKNGKLVDEYVVELPFSLRALNKTDMKDYRDQTAARVLELTAWVTRLNYALREVSSRTDEGGKYGAVQENTHPKTRHRAVPRKDDPVPVKLVLDPAAPVRRQRRRV